MPPAPGREGESVGKQMGRCSVTVRDCTRVLGSCDSRSTDLNYSEPPRTQAHHASLPLHEANSHAVFSLPPITLASAFTAHLHL